METSFTFGFCIYDQTSQEGIGEGLVAIVTEGGLVEAYKTGSVNEIQWMMMWVEEAGDPSCPG